MKWGMAIPTTVLALALAGCSNDADPASETASGISSTVASPSQSSSGLSNSPSGEASGTAGAAQAACGQQTAPRPDLIRQLPADFPTVTGWQPTKVTNQGQTREVSGVLRGEVGDLVTVRDNAADELVSSGYDQTGTDEEVGYEAEAEFEGTQEVSIKVKPLCRDYLVLTYTVRQ
jgi:hypothetical protein